MMTIRDRKKKLIAKAPRMRNRMYRVHLQIEKPVCLASHTGEDAWIWHARFGHQSFDSLEKLSRKDMVRGLPMINHVEQLCEACLAGKHRRTAFPQMAKYRATKPLELVHGDLCGPISPSMPGGKRYFLLLVDDYIRYMWIIPLHMKDEASATIRRSQAGMEVEARHTSHSCSTWLIIGRPRTMSFRESFSRPSKLWWPKRACHIHASSPV